MLNNQQGHPFWALVIFACLTVPTVLSLIAIYIVFEEIDAPSQRALIAVLILACCAAAVSFAATLWMLWRCNPWVRSLLTLLWASVHSRDWRAIVNVILHPIRQRISAGRSASGRQRRWVLFWVPLSLGVLIIFIGGPGLPALIDKGCALAIWLKPWQDLLAAIGILLISLAFGLAMRRAGIAIFFGIVLFAAFLLGNVLSDTICGIITSSDDGYCATFSDFENWRKSYTAIGFTLLGALLARLWRFLEGFNPFG